MPLTKRHPTDAMGAKLDPAKLYEPITSFARGHYVYNRGQVQLRGDHEAIEVAPQLWIAVDASSEEKERTHKAHIKARLADLPPQGFDVHATKILSDPKIPQARRMIGKDAFWSGPDHVTAGAARDIDDAVVKRAPEMFRPYIEPDEAA